MEVIFRVGFGGLVAFVIGLVLWRRRVMELPSPWSRRADTAEVIAVGAALGFVAFRSYMNLVSPDPWDFPVFYTVARNAADGLSFYQPDALLATFTEVQRVWDVPGDWLQEVGFWYAPPTALWLLPLGHLGYTEALLINDIVQMSLFVASVFLLHRYFPLRSGSMGLVDMALLGLLFRPVLSAFGLSQIVFGALLSLVIAYGTIESRGWISGIALGVGSVFKHLLIIPALLAVFMRKWKVAIGAVAALGGALMAAGMVFGFDVYQEFLGNGPSDRSPELALDAVIQSLNGVMRRVFDAVPSGPGALDAILYPPYLLVAGVLTVVTLVIVWRASSRGQGVVPSLALLTLLALLVYPNTLFNTLPLMIPAIVVLIWDNQYLRVSPRFAVIFIASAYGALAGFQAGFLVLAAVWVVLTAAMLQAGRRQGRHAAT